MLEQFRISDFVEWHNAKSLVINRDFQRGSVWSPAAKIYLIDTILRDLPIPKIYMRSFIDRDTKKTKREVVDGQQRLRAILDFVADKITLSSRAKEFKGLKFSTLDPDLQDKILHYPIAVDQLVNADDRLVLDVFARLNSYNVKLNPPELRHAEFQGDFKWSAHEVAIERYEFWRDRGVFSPASMVRMMNASLVAEMYGVLLTGVVDGGQPNITKIYRTFDKEGAFDRKKTEKAFNKVLDWIDENVADDLVDTPLMKPPHFLMMFAAIAHALVGIPKGALGDDEFDDEIEIADINEVREKLQNLAEIIDLDEEPDNVANFWLASSSSTQRIASRRIRFPYFVEAVSEA